MADVLSPENLASTAEALQSNPQSVAIRTPNEAEDFMARIGRTAASTFSPALQGVAQLEGNQGAVDYFRKQRMAQNANAPGDLIPTNPELDNSISATVANTIGSAGPRAGLLALTGGTAGMGLLAGETLAQNYALVPEQQAQWDAAYNAATTDEERAALGERPTQLGANTEGLGTLAAFAALGPAAARTAMPAIASVRQSLRPLAGIGVNALSNVAMDLGIRAGTSAVTGHPIIKDANDVAAMLTGGSIFGIHPGITQAHEVPAWQKQQQYKQFVANIIKAKKMEADAIKASEETKPVVPNTPPPENTVIKPATEDETGIAVTPPKQTPPLVPTAALDPTQTLIPNSSTAVENTSTKPPQVVVTPKAEPTETEEKPGTSTEIKPIFTGDPYKVRDLGLNEFKDIPITRVPPAFNSAEEAVNWLKQEGLTARVIFVAHRPDLGHQVFVPHFLEPIKTAETGKTEVKPPTQLEPEDRLKVIDEEMEKIKVQAGVAPDGTLIIADDNMRAAYEKLAAERIRLALGHEPVDLTNAPVDTGVRPDLTKFPPPFTDETQGPKPVEFPETQKPPAVKPNEVTEVVTPVEEKPVEPVVPPEGLETVPIAPTDPLRYEYDQLRARPESELSTEEKTRLEELKAQLEPKRNIPPYLSEERPPIQEREPFTAEKIKALTDEQLFDLHEKLDARPGAYSGDESDLIKAEVERRALEETPPTTERPPGDQRPVAEVEPKPPTSVPPNEVKPPVSEPAPILTGQRVIEKEGLDVARKLYNKLLAKGDTGPDMDSLRDAIKEHDDAHAVRRKAFQDQGPGHKAFDKGLQTLVDARSIDEARADLLRQIFHPANDAGLAKLSDWRANAILKRGGMAHRTGGQGGKVWASLKKGTMDIKPYKSFGDPLAAFLHEYGHLAEWAILNDADHKIVRKAFEDMGSKRRREFFAQGEASTTGETKSDAQYYAKNKYEFLVQGFAEYVLSKKVNDEQMVPVYKKLYNYLRDAIKNIVKRNESGQDNILHPIYEKMLNAGDIKPEEIAKRNQPVEPVKPVEAKPEEVKPVNEAKKAEYEDRKELEMLKQNEPNGLNSDDRARLEELRAKYEPKATGLTPDEQKELDALWQKKKWTKAESDRIDELQNKVPAKPNWNGEEKSSASLLIRRGDTDAGRAFERIRQSTSPFADLAAHLADNFPELMNGLRIAFHPDANMAFYDPNTHTIHLGEQHLADATILHEAVHGLTVNVTEDALEAHGMDMLSTGHDYLNGLKKAQDSAKTPQPIRDLIGQYFHAINSIDGGKNILGKDSIANQAVLWKADSGVPYGLMSLHEFLGEAFTDRGFQNILNRIKDPRGGSVMSRLVDSVRRVLGIPADANNLLARVIKTGGEVGELNTQRALQHAGVVPRTEAEANVKLGAYERANPDRGSRFVPSKNEKEKEIKLDVNMQQLMNLVGPHMYNKPIAEVATKELLQNAFDTVRDAGATDEKPGKIDINMDYGKRTMSFQDNGLGMTPEVIQKAFFTIGGTHKTGKPENTSGGLGLAKMAFILGSERIRLETVKDGVKSIVDATSDEVRNSAFKIKTSDTNEPNGTKVEIKIPEQYTDSNGEKRDIYFYDKPNFLKMPLIGPAEIRYNGEIEPMGIHQKGYQKENTFHFSWGDINLYIDPTKVDEMTQKYGGKIDVLSAGLHQFDDGSNTYGYSPDEPKLPYHIVLDVRPKVKTDNAAYPFNNQREGWRSTIEEDVKAMRSFIKSMATEQSLLDAKDTFEGLKQMPKIGTKEGWTEKELADLEKNFSPREKSTTQAPTRRVQSVTFDKNNAVIQYYSGKKETVPREEYVKRSFNPEKKVDFDKAAMDIGNLDPTVPNFHNNTNADLEAHPHAKEFFTETGNALIEFMRKFGEMVKGDYTDLNSDDPRSAWFGGISLDKDYRGLNMVKPMKAIWFNPANISEIGMSNPAAAASEALHIFIHEITHVRARSEGPRFTAELANNYARLRAHNLPIEYFERTLEKTFKKYWPTVQAINEQFSDYNTKNRAASFKSSSALGRGEPAETKGVGARPSDVDVQRNERVPEQGPARPERAIPPDQDAGRIGDILASKLTENEKPYIDRGQPENPPLPAGYQQEARGLTAYKELPPKVGGGPIAEAPNARRVVFSKNEQEDLNPGFYSKLAEIIGEKLPAALGEIPGMTVTGRPIEPKVIRNAKGEVIKTIPAGKQSDKEYPPVTMAQQVEALALQNGVKAEELKWSGIIPWLEGQKGKVTKQEVQDYLRNEGAVRFEERVLSSTPESNRVAQANEALSIAQNDLVGKLEELSAAHPEDRDSLGTIRGLAAGRTKVQDLPEGARDAASRFLEANQEHKDAKTQIDPSERPKFNRPDLVLPGGRDYKEVVLTVPQGSTRDLQGRMNEIIAQARKEGKDIPVKGDPNFEEYERIHQQMDRIQDQPNFTSSHFPESGNYVAHMRVNERSDSTGKKGTFIEEIQSDRHQQARTEGYMGDNPLPPDAKLNTEGWVYEGVHSHGDEKGDLVKTPEGLIEIPHVPGRTPEETIREVARRYYDTSGSIPDAPYRKDWGVQMFKRALRDAIAKGQDWVGWTKGDTQAERYDLSKQIDSLGVGKNRVGEYHVEATRNGETVINKSGLSAQDLADTIGKDLSSKAVGDLENAQPGKQMTYKGLDLKVGGEGMKGFYDTILPNEIGKYVKQWGGKVEEGRTVGIGGGGGDWQVRLNDGSYFGSFPSEAAARAAIDRAGSDIDSSGVKIERGETPQGVKYPEGSSFHKVAITPEMREAITGKRQPLFAPKPEPKEETGQAAQLQKPFLQRAFDTLKGLPFIGKTISKIADSKIVGRIQERLKPAVQDLRESIESKFRGMEFIKNNFATQVRKGIEIAFNHNKADMEAAYPILEAGGGRIGEGPTEAQSKQYQDALETLKNAEVELNGPDLTEDQRKAVQKEIDNAKQVVEDYHNLPPSRDDVYRYIQRELANGKKALASDKISDKAKENIKKYLPAYEKALADFDRLLPGVKRVKEAFDDAFNVREDAGLDPHYIEDYVARVYEKNPERNNSPLPAEALIGGGKSGITSFDHSRKYDTIMDAMIGRQENGRHEFETPKSFDVSDLAANHAAVSMDMASNKLLADTFETTSYPGTNEPLFVPKPKVGESLPPNYVAIDGPFRQPIFVYNQVADLFKSIFGESQLRNSDAGNILLKASGAIKHGTLALDTFHLSRVMQKAFMEAVASGDWQKVADFKKNMPSYTEQGQMGKYLGALDVAMKDIPAAIKAGMLTEEDGAWIRGDGQVLKKRAESGGLLAGKFTDNLWKEASGFLKAAFEAVHLPKGFEKLEQFNKFTFDRTTKAAMMSAFESRLKRIDRDFPELTEHQRNIKAAKEVNEQFGNIGRGGLLKSKTAQDYANLFMLAPNWVQSQIMAEARQYGQGARAVFDATVGKKLPNGERERVFRVGNSARFLATTALSVFAANQAINLATRGKPTWENEEEGHKMDAWIPSVTGGPGFFYSPWALASEYRHHLENYGQYESFPAAVSHIASNKLSPLAGAAKVALTQKDYTGKKLTPGETVKAAVRQALPVPILASSTIKGFDSTQKAGSAQHNISKSFGISLDKAPDAVAQAYQAFQPYRTKDRPDTGPSPYKDLKTLVQNGADSKDIKAEVDRLVKEGKKLPDIRKSFEPKPFSGSIANDLKGLKEKPELKKIRDAAIKQKKDEAEAFRKALSK